MAVNFLLQNMAWARIMLTMVCGKRNELKGPIGVASNGRATEFVGKKAILENVFFSNKCH